MAETKVNLNEISTDTGVPAGWVYMPETVSSVAYNGNRSYSLTMSADVSATLSLGMRVRTTRTVLAPTQCTSLNGTNQYWNKTSPNKLTFTDDFVVTAWVKLTSYSGTKVIASRYNGTSGWQLYMDTNNYIILAGYNNGASNVSLVNTYQTIPLNKWVHIAAELDMSSYSASPTTSYIMIDGVDVPVQVQRSGTNPTTLIQAGNLEIGTGNATNLFPGKIAQVAIFNAKVTQATIRGYISQGLTGSETSLASAYSFNGVATDLNTTTPNDLTAQGSAAYSLDSPFTSQANGVSYGTLDYGIVQSVSTTTVVVQVPEGCTIPTSGGVSAISYSTQKAPYNMPVNTDRWEVLSLYRTDVTQSSPTQNVWYNIASSQISIPVGSFNASYSVLVNGINNTANNPAAFKTTLSTGSSSETDKDFSTRLVTTTPSTGSFDVSVYKEKSLTVTSATIYYFNMLMVTATGSQLALQGSQGTGILKIVPSML